MVGLDQVNFRKNGTTRRAVIEGLHVRKEVPVVYGDGVQAAVVAAGVPRTHPSWVPGAAGTPKVSWSGE